MIDIHCHILPGIDDGPFSIEQSVEMARIAADDGITALVATPHISDASCSAEHIGNLTEQLNDLLVQQNIPVTIVPGAEVYALLDPHLFAEYTIHKTPYILTEFPFGHLPWNAKEILRGMSRQGYRPIIAHPERNSFIVENPDLLLDLVGENIYVQITADSLTGVFGRSVQNCALSLLEKGVVHFIATDAHTTGFRSPVLSEGLRAAQEIIGRKEAEKLVTANPGAVIEGKAL